MEMIEQQDRTESSKLMEGLERCKSLGRMVKRQRTPQWPTLAVSHLPSKDISDTLVSCYLRTIETVYRVLHVPTFRRDYEAIWTPGSKPDTSFMIQLKLVLAIGATLYDEKFSMRSKALQWVYEAQTWVAEPEFKAQLSLQYLQTRILLLLARETTSVGEDFTWISAGALVRAAVYMGLHRDPVHLPKRTLFGAEMRRRLWNTILELSLHSSLVSGGPPLMSLDMFDSEPPRNFDDEQLLTENPVSKPEDEFSHTTIARAFRRTWEIRLRIAEYLNDLASHGTYDEALQLDHDFRALYKELSRTIQRANFKGERSPAYFAINYVDFAMRRWLMSVHVPFLGPTFYATTYAFSHKVVIDASLKLWKTTNLGEALATSQAEDGEITQARRDLTRLATSGNGYLRTCTFQASFLLAGELLNQLREDEGLGPLTLRPDLLAVLNESKDWSLKCLEAGETNVKGYLLNCLLASYVEGLTQGLDKPELSELLFKTAEEAEVKCLTILELAALQNQTRPDNPTLSSPDSLADPMGEWDYMISDDQFNFTNDSMNWLFNDEPSLPIF
ncbi:hypothetical protein LTR84_008797 [Exophiala bonariae]|uniref:Xylanolytic transcriptional activator regulatory domain-containing protein n=1 Tax=Exophiala bonariae TaxID=1690606 RepID=A0AAV9MWU9_9EURO|nr:hypothetical protein LTR84_008797 [Exophiala bonariae]